jgi:hypothetical protein
MSTQKPRFGPWATTVAGLLIGAGGIAILWASGVEFPIYPPPGIIILLAGAIFVGLASWRWAPAVGAFLGLFITVGFVASGGPPNLVGRDGTSVAIGTWIQLLGVLTALIAGVLATRANYRKQPQAAMRPHSSRDREPLPSPRPEPLRRARERASGRTASRADTATQTREETDERPSGHR